MATTNNTSRTYPGGPIRTQPNKRYRRVVFTLNNYTSEEEEHLKRLEAKWLIFGKEKGESGTPHLQGAIIWHNPRTLSAIKKTPGLARAHIEEMRGQPCDSKAYCSKEDPNPFEIGIMPTPGKRNDIHDVVQQIRQGDKIQDIIAEDAGAVVFVKYHKGLNLLRSMYAPERTQPPIVLWMHGPTGTGKTRLAVDLALRLQESDGFWISNDSGTWFDGYTGQSVAIFDDYRTSFCKFSMLLRLLDRYPLSAPVKGSYTRWLPKYIFITAPKSPTDMWNLRTNEDLAQLTRRITEIIQFDEETTKPDIEQILSRIGEHNKISDAIQSSPSSSQPIDISTNTDTFSRPMVLTSDSCDTTEPFSGESDDYSSQDLIFSFSSSNSSSSSDEEEV